MGLQDVVAVLETYRGREKTMRTLQYGLLFVTPLAAQKSKLALESISNQLGTARVILRLFDDLSMLQHSLTIVRTSKDQDQVVRLLQVVNTVADQLFFPMEHLAWARDIKVLRGDSSPFWHISLLLWTLSLILSIAKALRTIYLLKQTKVTTEEKQEKAEEQYQGELLTVIMQASDLLNALNWLPNRPWARPFPLWQVRPHQRQTWRPWHRPYPVWQVGLFGLISSLIGFGKLLTSLRRF